MYMYKYINIDKHTCTHTDMYMYKYINIDKHTHVQMYNIDILTNMQMYMYTYMYMYMYMLFLLIGGLRIETEAVSNTSSIYWNTPILLTTCLSTQVRKCANIKNGCSSEALANTNTTHTDRHKYRQKYAYLNP